MDSSGGNRTHFSQNVIVMRHGDRIDNFVPRWTSTASRPWDPPLIDDGKVRAFRTGRSIRRQLATPIHRVFVSPFLRCLQTAFEVVIALCAVGDDDHPGQMTSDGVKIDPSKVKVAIEYGLCEMLNTEAVRLEVAPKDGDFAFDMSQCEAVLPAGTVDDTVEPIYKELPKWEESMKDAKSRYANVIKALADKYPSENLLLVTHGAGVGFSVSSFMKNVTVYDVEYCAYSQLQRSISIGQDQTVAAAGEFEVHINQGQCDIHIFSTAN